MLDQHKPELILFFFGLRQNLYLYHLSTYGYARHVASGDLVDKFDDFLFKFLHQNIFYHKI